MICNIDKGSVNYLSSGRCPVRNSGYTGPSACQQHRDDFRNALERKSNATVQGNLDFIC
jgi:hypothetical protein